MYMYVAKQHLKTPLKSGTNALQRCCFSIVFKYTYTILYYCFQRVPSVFQCFPHSNDFLMVSARGPGTLRRLQLDADALLRRSSGEVLGKVCGV
jgi:hypothetical protein